MADIAADTAVLDAELVHGGANRRADFFALLCQMRLSKPDEGAMMLIAFDVLFQDGVDVRGPAASERSRDLARLVRKSRLPCLKLVESFPDGGVLLEHCERFGIEGVVSKRVDRSYFSGASNFWFKTNCIGWRRRNQRRYKFFAKPVKPSAPTERKHALERKLTELLRVQEALTAPEGLRPGLAAAFKAQERVLLQEIAELEVSERRVCR